MPQQQFQKITAEGVRGMFFRRLEEGDDLWVNQISMRVASNQAVESYGFLGQVPQMQEWLGGREAKYLREFSFDLRNKDYEATLGIKDKDMRRDKTDQVRVRVNDLAVRAMRFPTKLVSDLILTAESATCYDGQFYFDTDHAEGESGTQSNDVTYNAASATAPTVDEMADAILKSIQQMYGFKDDRGEPVNENAAQFVVMVPIPFWATALSATANAIISDGTGAVTNLLATQNQLAVRVVPNPRLTWTTKFATFRADSQAGAMPFIIQEEIPLELDALTYGSDHYFKNDEHLFSARWAGTVGFGDWRHAVLTTFN